MVTGPLGQGSRAIGSGKVWSALYSSRFRRLEGEIPRLRFAALGMTTSFLIPRSSPDILENRA
jgi:hypothetical protein